MPPAHNMQSPFSSRGKPLLKGVWQLLQKYAARIGAGVFRHSAHTGTRLIRVNGRLQIRHSSGNTTEKSPCGILQARLKSASAEPTRVLEKAHLPVTRTIAFAADSWQMCSVTLNNTEDD